LNEEDDGYWDEGEAPWRESASKYDESNPFSLKNILWLSENNKYPSWINDSEHRVMEKLISLLSNWDIEPEYSEVTQEMLQKACGDFPSKRDMKHTLNSLSKKGLIDVQNVPTGEYKRDKGGFMVIGKDKRPIALTEPLIYPKPLMCLYAWNTGLATPKWLQNEIAENIAQENKGKLAAEESFSATVINKGKVPKGSIAKAIMNQAMITQVSIEAVIEELENRVNLGLISEDDLMKSLKKKFNTETFAGEMDATQCDYCEKNNAKSEFPPVKGYWEHIDPAENHKRGYCSQECFVGSLGECDDCRSPFKIGDNYNLIDEDDDATLHCDDCFKGYPICEFCDVKYHPEGEHNLSLTCSYCRGDGYIMTSYTPSTYYDPAESDGHDCEACGGSGSVCSEGEGYDPYAKKSAESYTYREWEDLMPSEQETFKEEAKLESQCDNCTNFGEFGVDIFTDKEKKDWVEDKRLCKQHKDELITDKSRYYFVDWPSISLDEYDDEDWGFVWSFTMGGIPITMSDEATQQLDEAPEDVQKAFQKMMGFEGMEAESFSAERMRSPCSHCGKGVRIVCEDCGGCTNCCPQKKTNQCVDCAFHCCTFGEGDIWNTIDGRKYCIDCKDEDFAAESNELEESKKRTKMSMIRTGLAITTFGIVLFNLWTNKKQEKDIADIMDLV